MTDQKDRRELMQRLNNKSWREWEDDEQARILGEMNRKCRWTDKPIDKYDWYIVAFLLSIVAFIFYGSSFITIDKGQLDCSKCHSSELSKKQRMVSYFIRKGSPEPEKMADAVLQTHNPRLLASIAVRETRGDHTVRRTGYRKQHDGAFQVNPRYWGKVSKDPIEQALQAESILVELQETHQGDLRKALNAYGGDTTKRMYAYNVLKELQEVPKW